MEDLSTTPFPPVQTDPLPSPLPSEAIALKRPRQDDDEPSPPESPPLVTPPEMYPRPASVKRVRYEPDQWSITPLTEWTNDEQDTQAALCESLEHTTWATLPWQILHRIFQFLATATKEELSLDLLACSLVCEHWHNNAFPEFVSLHLTFLRLGKTFHSDLPRFERLLLDSQLLGLSYPSLIQGIDLHPHVLLDVTNLLMNFDPIKPPPTMPEGCDWVDLDIYLEHLRPEPLVSSLTRIVNLASPFRVLRLHDVYNKQSFGWELLRPFFALIAPACASVREFALYESAFSDVHWDHCLADLVSGIHSLDTVRLNDCRNDSFLFDALAHHRAVTVVYLTNMDWVTSNRIAVTLGAWPALRVLEIDGGLLVTPELIDTVADGCPALEELVLRRDDEDQDDERPGSAHRRKLDRVLASLAARIAGPPAKRRRIAVGANVASNSEAAATDKPTLLQTALVRLVDQCPFLTRFELDLPPRFSRPITNDFLLALLTRARRLRRLTLLFLKFVTGKGLVAAADVPGGGGLAPGLETLDFRGCDNLQPACIEVMLKSCPLLNWLDLPANFAATKEGKRMLGRLEGEFGFRLKGEGGRRSGVWKREVGNLGK